MEDIPVLVDYFLEKFAVGKRKTITEAAMARLMEHHWSGNVRELSNVVQNLIIMTQGETIDESSFAPYTLGYACEYDESKVKATGSGVAKIADSADTVLAFITGSGLANKNTTPRPRISPATPPAAVTAAPCRTRSGASSASPRCCTT